MITGVIMAPREAESEIRAAGFTILNISYHENCSALHYFTVEGQRSALEVINDRWGEWTWSLEEVVDT